MRYTPGKEFKNRFYRHSGIKFSDLARKDHEEIDNKVEQKLGKKLKFKNTSDKRLIGRGSVFLYLNRIKDILGINKKISRI